MNTSLIIALSTLTLSFAQAQTSASSTEYTLADAKSTGVTFQIAYSLGIHDGNVSQMNSSVKLSEKNKILSGEFSVPLSAMATGNSTRDCHMTEALGIDYKNSKFPAEHVCANDQLPASGPDAMAFDHIQFKFVSLKDSANAGLPEVLEVGKVYNLAIQGQWTIHGVTQEIGGQNPDEAINVQVKLLDPATGELQLFGKFELSLAKFGVVVKPFKIAFVKIGVADIAKIIINTRMIPKK